MEFLHIKDHQTLVSFSAATNKDCTGEIESHNLIDQFRILEVGLDLA